MTAAKEYATQRAEAVVWMEIHSRWERQNLIRMIAIHAQSRHSQIDITPRNSTFLYGYPHVSRLSTGVHDPLLSSSLYLDDGGTGASS